MSVPYLRARTKRRVVLAIEDLTHTVPLLVAVASPTQVCRSLRQLGTGLAPLTTNPV